MDKYSGRFFFFITAFYRYALKIYLGAAPNGSNGGNGTRNFVCGLHPWGSLFI